MRATWLVAAALISPAALAQTVSLENTGEPLPEAVRERINSLLAEEDTADTRFEARRQARRAADIVLKVLNSEGYFDADAEISVELEPKITPKVILNAGELFRFSDVSVLLESKNGTIRDDVNVDLVPRMGKGDPARADQIISEERRMFSQLRDAGYPEARILDRALIGDRENTSIDLTYRYQPGALVCMGDITLKNKGVTRPVMINRLSEIEPGQAYDADKLATLERRLVQTRMFDLANVELATSSEDRGESGCQIREIIIDLDDAPRQSVGLGASYSTSEGMGFQGDWQRRNFTGRLDTLRTSLLVAELEREFELAWEQPVFGGYGRTLTFALTATDEETDAYDRSALGISADYDYRWTDRLTLSTGASLEHSREDDGETERDINLISGLLGGTWDGTDSALDPTQGFRVYLQGEPSYAIGDTEGAFIRTTSEVRGYTGINSDRFVLAGRFKMGSVYGAEQAELPVDRRFFAGGGGSVRGYGYQALGPEDDEGDPIGGRSLIETSIEGRWRIRDKYGAVLFVDAGEATKQELPRFSDLRAGVGVGFRYFTQFGPLRLDIATPLDKREDDDPVQVYISIGQAF
ncbi:MAG: hypothetical protein CME88_05320 [Hirschia sp.]|nr:hypothetical protein [Hirschia sp.]MBB35717.1 hypothetical protein [Hirschia sp.]MBF17784.1 hypothetical protein [Hirschia sp.]